MYGCMNHLNPGTLFPSLFNALKKSFLDAFGIFWELFRIIIPITIATRILEQFGLIDKLGDFLGPLMHLVGLPGEMGLVWASALVINIYTALIVFASLAPGLDLTVAQVTIVTTMILIAHALPVELRIAQKVGTRFRAMLLLRLGGAYLLGWLLHMSYQLTGTLQEPSQALWDPPAAGSGWGAWLVSQLQSMLVIFAIIFALVIVLEVLKKIGITALMTKLLEPVLTLLGMSREVAPLAIIGMTLGISYGGGLLIREAESGKLGKRDIFISLALMGLCHSVIEDTLVMLVFGAHISGVLWGRVAFSLVVVFILARLLRIVPQNFFERYLVRPLKSDGVATVDKEEISCC